MKHILIVEDDRALGNGIALALTGEAVTVELTENLGAARSFLTKNSVDLAILDINLPDGSGLELLPEIKGVGDTAVILLTANDLETDIVAGLESGADDYITKPFSLAVLRARVHTQLRKAESRGAFHFAGEGFDFDFERLEFYKNGSAVELSKTEQKLLKLLLVNRGQILTRAQLTEHIWSDGSDFVDENALSVTVNRLRSKLEETPSAPVYIQTVYGVGYGWMVKKQ